MRYSKADIHMHTTESDGLQTPEAVVEYAATQTDLRVIAITDHDNINGSYLARDYAARYYPELEVIISTEITTADCDILALYIQDDIPAGLSAAETINRIHHQGGLAIAAHPYAYIMKILRRPGMEGAGHLMKTLPFDGVETRNATPSELMNNWLAAFNNRRWQNLPETGGSDSHYLYTVGSTYTLFPGKTAADFRIALETGQVRAGGRVYSPHLIFNVIYDKLRGRFPLRASRQPIAPRPRLSASMD